MRIASLILGTLLALSLAAPAEAYRYRVCGNVPLKLSGNSLTLYASTNSFPAGSWYTGLQNAVSQFNRNPSNFYYNLTTTTSVSLGNGRSEVWGSTNQSILQNAPAIAYSWWQCYYVPFYGYVAYMTEGDVIFDYTSTTANPFEWTTSHSRTNLIRYGGSKRLLQGTATHEFGHAIGLLHENRWYNVMGSDFTHLHTNSTTTDAYVGEDAGTAAVFLYGLWAGGPQDVALEHFKYLGTSGEYSTHQFTQLFNTLGTLTINGMTGYYVRRGQTIQAEFTFENVGRTTASNIPVRFYISTNDLISTSDTLIKQISVTLSRDTVSTWKYSVTIPSNLALNTNYFLGAYINPVGTISETDYSNNGTFLPIRVIP